MVMAIVMFPTWREADAFRLDIENQLRGGTFRPDGEKITVKEAADLNAHEPPRENDAAQLRDLRGAHPQLYLSQTPQGQKAYRAPAAVRRRHWCRHAPEGRRAGHRRSSGSAQRRRRHAGSRRG
jgi:hypothetical protein